MIINFLSDLDDTLYPYSSGLATACGNNIKGTGNFVVGISVVYFVQWNMNSDIALAKISRLHG